MARGWNAWFTKGTGTSQPQGIVTSATVIDGEAGSADDGSGGVDYANLLDLEYGVDFGYLIGNEGNPDGFMDDESGLVGWLMHRNVEKQLRGATDPNSHRPLWHANLEAGRAAQGMPGLINGYPYMLNNDMDGR